MPVAAPAKARPGLPLARPPMSEPTIDAATVPRPKVVHGKVMLEVIMVREMMDMLMRIVAKEMRKVLAEKTMTENMAECSAGYAMCAAAAVRRGVCLGECDR